MADTAAAAAMCIEDQILNDLHDLERATEAAQARAAAAQNRATAAESRAEQERAEKERLLERLRQASLEPD